jgi:hypothetical protein
VRAVLPHTALQSVVSSSALARQSADCNHGEPSVRSKEFSSLWTLLASATNMRSFHLQTGSSPAVFLRLA